MKQYLILITLILVFASTVGFAEGEVVSVDVKKMAFSGWDLLIFEGTGMRTHNVEITISNGEGFVAEFLTETTNRGVFFMPWIIPESLEAGIYSIVATDLISTATTIVTLP